MARARRPPPAPSGAMRIRPVFLLAVLLILCPLPRTSAPAQAEPRQAPSFTLPSQDGTVSLDSLRGKLVLVDFWASWCVPCHKSFLWMSDLHKRYAAKGLTIVAINLDKSRDAAYGFLEKHPAPFTIAFDPAGKTAEAFHVAAMPSSYLVGPDGSLLYTHAGFDPKKTSAIESRIQEALPR